MAAKEEVKELLARYQARIDEEFQAKNPTFYSEEYLTFKREYLPKPLSWYEKLCQLSEKIIKVTPGKEKAEAYAEYVKIAHLEITPTGVMSFALLAMLFISLVGAILGYFLTALVLPEPSLYPIFFSFIFGVILFFFLLQVPEFVANTWRLKASNQMVLSVFYVVTFMRHTSNLEGAMRFAADHLTPPLALDFKRVLWNIETSTFASLKESLDDYLETWRKYNVEFIEAMHLIEGSLYEGAESRRLALLDKALEVILDGTYEKMMHFAQALRSPFTTLNMLGIILPVLGLVILPLVVSFLTEKAPPLLLIIMISSLYNIILPVCVYFFGQYILSTRPTGYGQTDIEESNPELSHHGKMTLRFLRTDYVLGPFVLATVLAALSLVFGFLPILIHQWYPAFDFCVSVASESDVCFLDYHVSASKTPPLAGTMVGPYGMGAAIMSLLGILGFGLSIGLYYRWRSEKLIQIREKTKALELEFASALFQLGNRLGDGLPTEIAFGKVAQSMQGTLSGNFMELVSQNIMRLGMSVENAIFKPKVGALVYFPSNLINSSMKVLTQAVRKGPLIAAQALITISQYIKEIHKVDERLKDLLAETTSSMDSQIKFLAPSIAGIVIGITAMITTILGRLRGLIQGVQKGQEAAATGAISNFADILGDGAPTFYFQLIVGFYVVQIVYILTILVNGVLNGSDKVNERYLLWKNLTKSTILYVALSFILMVTFNLFALILLAGLDRR